ncbi:hypothetical protein K227x_07570 [Rubripirellula lacrimiformis]|uniref:Carboxypeptidase regulatory-like domain-containing protein n=1 Tax=Rubripirellula lacrimiformis TaxID=1930273 RepID=A0A517N5I5_9BACT|nr:carboxypeptidase-like regulatory domain-containing protein [Rubripirellula lacrimiformis]QDT02381.1 hypothetical protein K227x_07570 [Rubripirellula lacrimiformis]
MQKINPLLCTALILALASIGCDGGTTYEVVAATGIVLLDNKPIEGVSVTLVPQRGIKGRGGYATSASDGTFTLQSEPEVEGVVPGNYMVLFRKYAMPDGSSVPPGTSAADANLINQLPEIYSHPEKSPIYATIPPTEPGGLSFELSSRPKPGRR